MATVTRKKPSKKIVNREGKQAFNQEEKPKGRKGILEIPLGCSLNGPTRRMVADLDAIAERCSTFKNEIADCWRNWLRNNPHYTPVARPNKRNADKTILDKPFLSHDLDAELQALPFGAILAGSIKNQMIREFKEWLTAKVRYGEGTPKGTPKDQEVRWQWQKMKHRKGQLPTYDAMIIPLWNWSTCVAYMGRTSRGVSKGIERRLQDLSKSSCVLRFQIFSDSASRQHNDVVCRLNIGSLSPGNRRIVLRIASNELKLSDSRVVKKQTKRGTQWFFQMCYEPPSQSIGTSLERMAVLYPAFDAPFVIEGPSGERWDIGRYAVRWYMEGLGKLRRKRSDLRSRYEATGRGHGRGRFFEKWKPYSRTGPLLQRDFMGRILSEIVKFLKRFDCGSVVFREPGLQCRSKLFMPGKELDFDWTKFWTKLESDMGKYGVQLEKERISYRDLAEVIKHLEEKRAEGQARKGGD